jgi:hypothetical protein
MMPNFEIEEFAKILIEHVRDNTISNSDRNLRPGARYPVALRWKEEISKGTPDSIVNVIIPDIVDETIFQLLAAIDQELLRLSFTASNAKTVDLSTDGQGELGGWYMGTDGWREKYSQERFVDDFSDLK